MNSRNAIQGYINALKRVSGKVLSDLYNRLGLVTHWNIPKSIFPNGKREKVLIMIDSLGRAGSQRVVSYLAAELADECDVVLLIYRKKEHTYPIDPRVQLICMPHCHYGNKVKFNTGYIRELKRLHRIDVSISFLHTMNYLNVYSKGKERVILSERNNPKLAFPNEYPKYRKLYDQADYVIFQTEEVRGLFSETTQKHSCILPNPVSVTCCAAAVRKPRIVNVARLHKNKNQELLLRAFAAFLPDHPRYTLSLYGEGLERESLNRLASELGLDNKVIFHGNVSDIHEQIADAGMFVLSSNTEGMPNALLEAMMMGLPCISTKCTGAKEIIQDRQNGLLTELGNVDALASAMAYMADHQEEAVQMGKNAMLTAEAFRKETVMEQWKTVILES